MYQKQGLLIDYEFCVGCCQCEIACMESHERSESELGIHVTKIGPLSAPSGGIQYNFIPLPNEWCDLCVSVDSNMRSTACVKKCPYSVIKCSDIETLTEMLRLKSKQLLFNN